MLFTLAFCFSLGIVATSIANYFYTKSKLYSKTIIIMEDVANKLKDSGFQDYLDVVNEGHDSNIRTRLASVAAGGMSKKYLGKEISVSEIESMSELELNGLYVKYESRLSGEMITSLGSSLVNIYSKVLGAGLDHFEPFGYSLELDSEVDLSQDLLKDPFVNSALRSILCEIYYKYGMTLAPVMMGLISAKHIKKSSVNYKDGSNRSENGTTGTTGSETSETEVSEAASDETKES